MIHNIPKIESCVKSAGASTEYYITVILVSANVISSVINLLHIILLTMTPEIRKLRHFWILFNLTFSDISVSVMAAVWLSPTVNHLLLAADDGNGTAFIVIGMQSSGLYRYLQITLASLDRYYAVCKPFDYANSKVINNIGKLSIVGWVVNISFITFKVLYTAHEACIGEFGMYIISEQSTSRYLDMVHSVNMVVQLMLTTILLGMVVRELNRMLQRGRMTREDKEVRSATKYIIGTAIMFYCTLIPLILYITLNGVSRTILVKTSLVTMLVVQTLYGIGNVVLYGFFNPFYVRKIITMFRCKNAVSPS